MSEDKEVSREEALKKAVENTPRVFGVCDLVGLAEDDEDRYIYERRNRDSGYC